MTGPAPAKTSSSRRLVAAALGAAAAAITIACGTDFYEIPIETPIQAKLDVSAFQRVLVAGFVAGGTDDVDANQETVRLLRSQLRTKSSLKVIDADIMRRKREFPLLRRAVYQNWGNKSFGIRRAHQQKLWRGRIKDVCGRDTAVTGVLLGKYERLPICVRGPAASRQCLAIG